jgi:2,4-dienoyl-CoA reductase (NADPH2)
VPGKDEFYETLRYFRRQIELTGVKLVLNRRVTAEDLKGEFDDVVLATGIAPRTPADRGHRPPEGAGLSSTCCEGRKPAGKSVAIIGAGGIGFDVAEYLTHAGETATQNPAKFYRKEWGIDRDYTQARRPDRTADVASPREVWLLQRKASKLGDGLAKTTGWARRLLLQKRKRGDAGRRRVPQIDDAGLHISIERQGAGAGGGHHVIVRRAGAAPRTGRAG